MREIKFRAWIRKEKEMLPGITFEHLLKTIKHTFNPAEEGWEPVYLQYTGLKDKNKKEIYEGDIVYQARSGKDHEWKKDGWTSVIHWNNDKACFEDKHTGNEIDREDMRKVEIIGNIYENPELLK